MGRERERERESLQKERKDEEREPGGRRGRGRERERGKTESWCCTPRRPVDTRTKCVIRARRHRRSIIENASEWIMDESMLPVPAQPRPPDFSTVYERVAGIAYHASFRELPDRSLTMRMLTEIAISLTVNFYVVDVASFSTNSGYLSLSFCCFFRYLAS